MTDSPDFDIPSKDEVSRETHRKWLHELCMKHVDVYLMPSHEIEPLIEQVQELEKARMGDGFNYCVAGCDKSYVHHSIRVKHEVTQHGFVKEQYEQGRERDTMGYFHC